MKKVFLTAAALACATGAFAQDASQQPMQEVEMEETSVETISSIKPDFRSNWFISVAGGAQVYFGDHDRQAKFGDRIAPALDVAIGKWFSPVVGARLMWSGLSAKGATQTWNKPDGGAYSTGKEVPGKYNHDYGYLAESKFNFFTLHADMMFDFTNLFCGYKSDRVYNVGPYLGVGWAHVSSKPHQEAIVGNVGVFNAFHLGKGFDINIDVRADFMEDGFDGEPGRRGLDMNLSLSAGLTYCIPPRGWKKNVSSKVVEKVVYDNDAVNALRAQVAGLIAENERLEKEMAGAVVKHNVVSNVNGNYLIYFPINVSSLSNADRAQLDNVADMIKSSPAETRFAVVGYADKATGNEEINANLSRQRAESVRDYLVNEFNIPADRLETSWKGGVGNMFLDDPSLSRVVIISPINSK